MKYIRTYVHMWYTNRFVVYSGRQLPLHHQTGGSNDEGVVTVQ